MSTTYDLIIVGAGPAGLAAGIYASRAKLRTLLLDPTGYGGRLTNLDPVEDFPGFSQGIPGIKLAEEMMLQALQNGAEFQMAPVAGVNLAGESKAVSTSQGNYEARSVILAAGCDLKTLGVPGEAKLSGRGVSHCAACDGPLFSGQAVAVVGGGDSALEEALYLTRFASRVTVIHRRDQLRACKHFQRQASSNAKIGFILNATVEEIEGDEQVAQLRVRSVQTGEPSTLQVAAVFVYVGLKPNTGYLVGELPTDDEGYIPTNERMETAIPGVLAAGDIRSKRLRQIVGATAEGASAAFWAADYINGRKR